MKTAYYTFTTWKNDAMAAGFGGAVSGPHQAAMVRQPEQRPRTLGENKVIDLTAWRAANLDLSEEEPLDGAGWLDGECGETEGAEPVISAPRARRSRRAMITAELISTLSVVAVAAAIILRVLTF